ncbi:uncharacterized protein LOC111130586 [Crassostrea virginica]
MYRPYHNQNRTFQRNYSPYPEYQINQAQQRICSLFHSRISPRLERILGKHSCFTRPWSPYDRLEDHALPNLLPSSDNITQTIYPDPSPDYSVIARRLSEEEDQNNECFVYPDVDVSAPLGNMSTRKNITSDPGNDSGFGSVSDTPGCSSSSRTLPSSSRLPDFLPLNCSEDKPLCNLNSNATDINQKSHYESKSISISDDDSSVIAVSDDDDDNEVSIVGQFFSREEATTSRSEQNIRASSDIAKEPEIQIIPSELASDVKSQRRFFKCDYCDFKALNRGTIDNHFRNTGHTTGAEILGYLENEKFHCKSIIDPIAVHLVLKRRTARNLTDLVILCPICFKHFPNMYQCANHAKRDHNENVYGVGTVRGHHTIYVAVGLVCLCMKQFNNESEIEQHVHKCKNYKVKEVPNMSNIFVCPICFRSFDSVGACRSHVQSEAVKHQVSDNVQVTVLHVSQNVNKIPMLPYACGPTLQDVSEDRVIYKQNKKKAMKAWRKNKSQVLNAFHNGPQNKRSIMP